MTAPIAALLQPLKDRHAGITQGEWTVYDRGIGYEVHSDGFILNMGHKETFTKADATLIAAAPTDQAKLIAAIEKVAGIADELDAKVVIASENPAAKSHVANRIRAALTQALGGDGA